jgi:hypothetical protein
MYSNPVNTQPRVVVRDEPGMEGELVERLGKLTFKTQVEAFYTAYSKVSPSTYRVRNHLTKYSTSSLNATP